MAVLDCQDVPNSNGTLRVAAPCGVQAIAHTGRIEVEFTAAMLTRQSSGDRVRKLVFPRLVVAVDMHGVHSASPLRVGMRLDPVPRVPAATTRSRGTHRLQS